MSSAISSVPPVVAATLQKKQIDAQGQVAKGLIESTAPSAPKAGSPGTKLLVSA
jgi:hypothetical protein